MFYRSVSPTSQNLLQTSLDKGVSYFNASLSFLSGKIKKIAKHTHFSVSYVCRICNPLPFFSRNFSPTKPYTTPTLTKNDTPTRVGVSFFAKYPPAMYRFYSRPKNSQSVARLKSTFASKISSFEKHKLKISPLPMARLNP